MKTKNERIRFGLYLGFGMGLMMFAIFCDYSLGFYYGSILIEDKTYNSVNGRVYNLADVFTVFFCIVMGTQAIGQSQPILEAFALGREAAF